MIAIDTNVLVRLFVADDKKQAASAARLMGADEDVFVAKTVVVELMWVLSAVYGTSRAALIRALETLAGLQRIVLEDRSSVERAIDLFSKGLDDFADALHLCSVRGAESFVTFDRKLIPRARKPSTEIPVRMP